MCVHVAPNSLPRYADRWSSGTASHRDRFMLGDCQQLTDVGNWIPPRYAYHRIWLPVLNKVALGSIWEITRFQRATLAVSTYTTSRGLSRN